MEMNRERYTRQEEERRRRNNVIRNYWTSYYNQQIAALEELEDELFEQYVHVDIQFEMIYNYPRPDAIITEAEREEGAMNEDSLNVQQNNDNDIPEASFSMSQQIPEIIKEEEEEEHIKEELKSWSTFETGESSSSSSSNQQQELLNGQNRSGKTVEDKKQTDEEPENRFTSRSEDEEGAKNQDSLNVQQNNDNGIPQGSFSMPQQTPEIDKGKGLLIFEIGESSSSSSSNQQQQVLSIQIKSAEAEEEEKLKEEGMGKLPEVVGDTSPKEDVTKYNEGNNGLISSSNLQQELLNDRNGSAKDEEDEKPIDEEPENRCTSRSTEAGDGEGAKNEDSMNVQQNNDHNIIPQASFSMSQQTPEIDKGKGTLLTSETGELSSSSSNQQQQVLSNQIMSAEAEPEEEEENRYTLGLKHVAKEWFTQKPASGKAGSSSKPKPAGKMVKLNELEFGHRYNLNVEFVNRKIKGTPQNTVAECQVQDDTGTIVFTARGNAQVELMDLNPGTILTLHNAEIKMFKGERRLSVDNVTDIQVPL